MSYALALMELAAGDGALSTIVSIQNSLVAAALVRHGNAAQQKRFLPALVSGDCIGAFALTEADAGSDAAAIRCRATKQTGGYVLNGTKQFITSGRIAGLAIVFAVTDPDAAKRGISAFLVPTDRPGYHVDKVEHKLGQAASDTCALRFADLFLENELRLGEDGAGYAIALANLEAGRIGIAAQSVGMARAALELATGYARDRKSFGKPIIQHQAVGFRHAGITVDHEQRCRAIRLAEQRQRRIRFDFAAALARGIHEGAGREAAQIRIPPGLIALGGQAQFEKSLHGLFAQRRQRIGGA